MTPAAADGEAGAASRPTPVEGKRPYAPRMPPEERREQILDAALELIAERGYEAVSMEGIARAAGVTKPVVYDLFGSLADLLEALLEREEQRSLMQLAELTPQPRPDADPTEVLTDSLDAFLRAVEARPQAWKLNLTPVEAMPRTMRESVERGRGLVAQQLESVVRWGVGQLNAPIEDVELLVETIILLAEQGARLHMADPERYPAERVTGFAASLLASVQR